MFISKNMLDVILTIIIDRQPRENGQQKHSILIYIYIFPLPEKQKKRTMILTYEYFGTNSKTLK